MTRLRDAIIVFLLILGFVYFLLIGMSESLHGETGLDRHVGQCKWEVKNGCK
jgi:hypothetical protein